MATLVNRNIYDMRDMLKESMDFRIWAVIIDRDIWDEVWDTVHIFWIDEEFYC